jgi:hypothetical protein
MNDDEEYRQWGADDREDYMQKPGGIKNTSLFTLNLLIDNLDKLKGDVLDGFIAWANGDPGRNWASGRPEDAVRAWLPDLPLPPEKEDESPARDPK